MGLLAASRRFPLRRFRLACAVGNSVKDGLLAFSGNTAMGWIG